MARCRVDKSIERVRMGEFEFPLGVYPVEPMTPRQGYTMWFEPADGSDPAEGTGEGGGASRGGTGSTGRDPVVEGFRDSFEEDDEEGEGLGDEGDPELEEWPDRYVFDVAITANRLEPLCRALLTLLPGRIYPILDILGNDAFREVDPYVSYDLMGLERFQDAIRRYRGFFYEDGLVGFGAMSEEPFVYIFVDEHKIVTVRVETNLKERVEEILAAFDLEQVQEIAGADAAVHEHRGVLDAPDDRTDLLNNDEILEELRDEWALVLNVDATKNVDEEGAELGITGWRCVVRWESPGEDSAPDTATTPASSLAVRAGKAGEPAGGGTRWRSGENLAEPRRRYAEALITAGSLEKAEDLALGAVRGMVPEDDQYDASPAVLTAERMTAEEFQEMTADEAGPGEEGTGRGGSPKPGPVKPDFRHEKAWRVRWMV